MLGDEELIELSKATHLLITRAVVAGVMSSGQWCRRLEDGDWASMAPGVWCHRATQVDWRLQARAGLLSLGREAALYGRTAACWWDVGEMKVEDVEFVVPRWRKCRVFPYTIRSTRHWDTGDLLTHEGLRVTNVTRTVIDLASGGNSAGVIEKAIDQGISRRLTTFERLRSRLAVLGGRGVTGTAQLRALILDSGGDSYLERRFLELVRRAGLPRPACQVVHQANGKRIARVDFQFRGTNLIVEVSGRLGHVSDRDRQRDARRRNALQASGNIVLEFTTADVLDAQPYVIETVTVELAKRLG